ncbi:hypothetical protein K503DRAFT_708684 [Rhizopogon vinicolor AM-OR11-026]|uniref:WW domain-containing protein n=1 Tax=Rhizopogon vinicolor AM-OR11-026 TaxID=1314800 RepID=A0A1B7NES1_9AGAM|nr:hypothetical protein K503DRAFT_708684 [Rhizopogon vinicolor AM-OR11-026]
MPRYGHETQRLVIHLRALLNVLSRYLSLPLRLMHRLFHSLWQRYSRVASTRLKRSNADGPSDLVAGSCQPILPQYNQPQIPVPSLPGPPLNSSIPTSPLAPAPPSLNHAVQPTSANLAESSMFPPFLPSEVIRYDKPPHIKPIKQSPKINPLTTNYTDIGGGDNWSALVHPEGALYFHDSVRGIYTDSNLQSQGRRRKMNSCITDLLGEAARLGLNLTGGNDIELVVQLFRKRPGDSQICKYYFVDHPKRLILWIHEQHTEKLFEGVRGVEKLSHIKYAVEHQYWSHCELYPNVKLDVPALLHDLREVVVHASAENVTTDLSVSPFDGDELSKISDLISQLQENVQSRDGCQVHSVCVIARFMGYFAQAKFFNFCGLPAARLNADQSVYVKTKNGKLIVTLSWAFNAALFGAPESYMSELRRVWVDRSINSPRWKNFNNKLSSEWSGITMYSTVMIAVDVSFLAVPTVMPTDGSQPPPVIGTYISVFFVVGSLVGSLFLTRQNRHQESADQAVNFLMKMTGSAFGTKALATVHSLPYAMLLWGMVYFMFAFAYQVFSSTLTITLATTGCAFGLVVVFTLWLIYAARDFHISKMLSEWFKACFSKTAQGTVP